MWFQVELPKAETITEIQFESTNGGGPGGRGGAGRGGPPAVGAAAGTAPAGEAPARCETGKVKVKGLLFSFVICLLPFTFYLFP